MRLESVKEAAYHVSRDGSYFGELGPDSTWGSNSASNDAASGSSSSCRPWLGSVSSSKSSSAEDSLIRSRFDRGEASSAFSSDSWALRFLRLDDGSSRCKRERSAMGSKGGSRIGRGRSSERCREGEPPGALDMSLRASDVLGVAVGLS